MNLLVRATNWVGDAILSLPALRAVRRKFPQASIAILARSYVGELYKDQSIFDEFIPYDPQGRHQGWGGRETLAADLRRRSFDAALLLQNAFEAAWIAWRAGIPERIGYARDGRTPFLTHPVQVPRSGEIPAHERFYYLELLRRAGWLDTLGDDSSIRLEVPEESHRRARETLLAAGVRPQAFRVAIGAGASFGSAKCWPPARFAEWSNRMQSLHDVDIILFGTAAETAVATVIKEAMHRRPVDLTGETRVSDLPALLSQCDLFLGNDSGAMHIAAAVGLPVVAIFGPTDPSGTAPVTSKSTIVQVQPYCSPCFLRRCPIDHRCMTSVTTELVEQAAERWLPQPEARRD